MRHTHFSGKTLLAMAIAGALATQNAQALSFQPTDEVSVDWDTTLSYGAAWRMQKPDADLIAPENLNGDDGNRSFKKGSMINNRVSVLSEVDVRYKDYGLFLRGSAFYDGAYFGENDNDSPDTFNGSGKHNRFSDAVKDAHGSKARVLDAFAYGNFDIADRNLNVRVGQQVLSWGTSLYIPGISGAQGPADGTKATVPGVEVKDILLPVGQVALDLELTDSLSLTGYTQWEWKKTEVPEAGSFFSTSDTLDEAGEKIFAPPLAPIQRVKDIEAKDSGQWGVGLEYYADWLGYGTDFGLYHINYHDKTPTLEMTGFYPNPGFGFVPNVPEFLPGEYRLNYKEDIKLTGASFSTIIGNTNFAGEIAYRKDTPIDHENPAGAKIGDTLQIQVNAIHSFGNTFFADDVLFTGEFGMNEVLKVKDGEKEDLHMDRTGSGISGGITLKYNNVAPATNLEIPINFSRNIDGNSAAGGFTNQQNTSRVSVGTKLFYKDQVEGSVSYVAYFGDAKDNQFTDRDFASINLKYSF